MECYVTEKFSKEVCCHLLRRGIWTAARLRGHGLLDPSAEVPGEEDDCFRAHPLWSCLATRGQYRLVWKKAAKRRRRINIGELRAFLKAERLSSTLGSATRSLICGDSQVALGALLKGRSSSRNLSRELQSFLAWYLEARLQPQYAYFPTELNAADDPTTSQEVRPPIGSLPFWWGPLYCKEIRGNLTDGFSLELQIPFNYQDTSAS